MPKFRKKPVVIEAEQWFPGRDVEGVKVLPPDFFINHPLGAYVPTLEGPVFINEGDWIIRDTNCKYLPCKPDIFEQTYEPVEEQQS